jgi:hypothetical protein
VRRAGFNQHIVRVRLPLLLLCVLALALVVRTSVRDRGVITDHLEFGRRLLAGRDLYAPYLDEKSLHAPYPPSFGLLTAPFSMLPERVARVLWGIAQVAALLLILALLHEWLLPYWPNAPSRAAWVVLASLTLASRFVLRDTHGGGGNLINLALALHAFAASARGRERVGGALLGLSLATKPTMILLWPLLLAFGYRRAAMSALITLAVCVLASFALLRFDAACWLRWLEGSWHYAVQADVFAPPAWGFPPFTWMNQCLRCALARVLGDVPAPFAAQVAGFVPGLGLSPVVVAWLRTIAAMALLAITAAVVWRHRTRPPAYPALLAAVLALSLLLSPISWKAHHVTLLPCFALLFAAAWRGARWAWVAAAIYALACVLGEEITGKAAKQVLQSSYVVTLGTLGFWAFALRRAPRNEAQSAPRTPRR